MTEDSYLTDDGFRISYLTWPEESVESDLPAVVLHHGFLANATSNWVGPGIVDALVASGRRVVGIDARGHGHSDKPHDPDFYGRDRMAADLSQLADHLGLPTYDLIGYSMGGSVALAVAASDRRVRRLAVGGIGVGALARGGVDSRVVAFRSLANALLTEDPESITDPTARQFRRFAVAMGNDLKAVAAQANAKPGTPIVGERITARTLVFVGDSDQLAIEPDRLAEAIPGSRLEILSGDHLSVLGDPRLAPLLVAHVGEG